jgi:hypothetical protein
MTRRTFWTVIRLDRTTRDWVRFFMVILLKFL